jgi:uncharacterized protein YjbI with pentapeptide repeats
VGSSRVGYDGSQHLRDEERSVERKKPARKRGQEPKKGIWTAVKDNAALVTAILALLGVLITGAINTYIANKDQLAQQKLEVLNAQRQRELEEQNAQDAALQTYLDQMGQMLLNEDLRSSEEDSDLRTLARARTLTTLRRLDPSRKVAVVRFLVEANLVQRVEESSPVISLANADLRGSIDLSGANLEGANLERANLDSADLSDADLSGADLRGAYLAWSSLRQAKLNGANLRGAELRGDPDQSGDDANLSEANLSEANLSEADLSYDNLSSANLQGANLTDADLTGAILSNAKATSEQLAEAKSLEGATMPDGQTLKGDNNPDGPTLKEWLKSKGKGEK